MMVYRLSKSVYARDLSGTGAHTYGGRWNSKGIHMVYTAQSRALCVLEAAVHLPLGMPPTGYQLVEIEIKPIPGRIYSPLVLPEKWNAIPSVAASRNLGDAFVARNEYLLMKVPSAIVAGDYNILINPKHSDLKSVRIKRVVDFVFDQRLLK